MKLNQEVGFKILQSTALFVPFGLVLLLLGGALIFGLPFSFMKAEVIHKLHIFYVQLSSLKGSISLLLYTKLCLFLQLQPQR